MRQCQPEWKKLISAGVALAAVIVLGALWSAGIISWNEVWFGLAKISLVTLLVGITWEWFRRRGWKHPLVQKYCIVYPDISGKWYGEVQSNFQRDESLPITIEILQTYTSIDVRFSTDHASSASNSVVAGLLSDSECRRHRLVYTYFNEPNVFRTDLTMHFGTALLDVEGNPPNRLNGQYMTGREPQTKGTITFVRSAGNTLALPDGGLALTETDRVCGTKGSRPESPAPTSN